MSECRSHGVPLTTDTRFVQRQLQRQADRVSEKELERTLTILERRGELTAERRRRLNDLATTIAEEIVAPPRAMLGDGGDIDPETVRAVVGLFDLDEEL